ncbi:serine hydrolase-domain-containing protein [Dunaliella salina]|uniref:Serine hydrolase-domain-containing protein n=1 Tax=Dunaliella salina TaxID=3046 RepID=A0ABQ7G2Y1_DUNSA|nr:serine hydrolase-domain-containing protein [Dunaliella salina]KAF5828971.1 serine hydrolase-domain-containing protein [Dunaliella salina]|eukprot:KAF5828970.1 serine hydrolase-domain-containing protein [Dunaliella salina]
MLKAVNIFFLSQPFFAAAPLGLLGPFVPVGGASLSKMLRLLALHSFRTSAAIFKWQIERTNLDINIGDIAEIVYMDAPNPASGPIPRDVRPFFGDGPFYEWTTVQEMGDQFEFDVEKLERSMSEVEKKLRDEGPFDGLIGFSQGTLLASVIVMLQHRGLILQTVPPLKFCILFAGLKSRYPPHAEVFKMGKVPVPSLHIYGDRDQIREHCVDLANAFQDPIVIQHPRGHSIPSLLPHQLAVMRAFLSSFLEKEKGGTAAIPGASSFSHSM